jgi:hypothetical protein
MDTYKQQYDAIATEYDLLFKELNEQLLIHKTLNIGEFTFKYNFLVGEKEGKFTAFKSIIPKIKKNLIKCIKL